MTERCRGAFQNRACRDRSLRQLPVQAFGVPGLGLKRGLADDLVVSPCRRCSRASSIRRLRRSNLVRLARKGLDGRFGFYESIDYRPRLLAADRETST